MEAIDFSQPKMFEEKHKLAMKQGLHQFTGENNQQDIKQQLFAKAAQLMSKQHIFYDKPQRTFDLNN